MLQFKTLTSTILVVACIAPLSYIIAQDLKQSTDLQYAPVSAQTVHEHFNEMWVKDIEKEIVRTVVEPRSGAYRKNTLAFSAPLAADDFQRVASKKIKDKHTTFEFIGLNQSVLDTQVYYMRYQQFYKKKPVTGGGYSVTTARPCDGPCPPVPEPCDLVLTSATMYAYDPGDVISSEGHGNKTKRNKVRKKYAKNKSADVSEIYMSTQDGSRRIYPVFKVATADSTFYVNSATEELIRTTANGNHTTVPIPMSTNFYNDVSYNFDLEILHGGWVATAKLISQPFSDIKTIVKGHDASQFEIEDPNDPSSGPSAFWQDITPSVSLTALNANYEAYHWDLSGSPTEVFSAYSAVADGLPHWKTLGIVFDEINVAGAVNFNNAVASGRSNLNKAYVWFGHRNGISYATRDVAAHELGHCFLNEFLDSDDDTEWGGLHEGISDILGTYIESKISGSVDWVIGDDAGIINRSLSRGQSWTNTQARLAAVMGDHAVGRLMGHWYFKASTESVDDYTMGEELAAKIVVTALNLVPRNAGYLDIAAATTAVAASTFGTCSPQYRIVAHAWEDVGIPSGATLDDSGNISCEFGISPGGTISLCPGNTFRSFTANNVPHNANVQWSLVGAPAWYKWRMNFNVVGGYFAYGTGVAITRVPTLSFYPATAKLKAVWNGQSATVNLSVESCGHPSGCNSFAVVNDRSGIEEAVQDVTSMLKLASTFTADTQWHIYTMVGQKIHVGTGYELEDVFPRDHPVTVAVYNTDGNVESVIVPPGTYPIIH